MRSQVRSTSSKRWLERSTVAPRAFSSRSRSMNTFCISGSRPLVGSSRISSSGAAMKAHTSPTFCLVPLLIFRIFPLSSSWKRSVSSLARPRSFRPRMSAIRRMNSRPVMSSIRASSPGR